MAAPSDFPDWATSENYSSGEHSGEPTKIEPTPGLIAQGHSPGKAPGPQPFNWWRNLVGRWVRHLDASVSDIESQLSFPAVAGSFQFVEGSASPVQFTTISTSSGGVPLLGMANGTDEISFLDSGIYEASVHCGLKSNNSANANISMQLAAEVNGTVVATIVGMRPIASADHAVFVSGSFLFRVNNLASDRLSFRLLGFGTISIDDHGLGLQSLRLYVRRVGNL